jgi:RES domain
MPIGTRLARVYYAAARYPTAWNAFRYFGPLNARWDHHLSTAAGATMEQSRGIYYAATDAKTCLAEVFQKSRRIDRAFQSPWLSVFESAQPLRVLDLAGDFATRMGASMAIHSGCQARARSWARDLYEAFPHIQGIRYASSMNGGAPAFALNERALRTPLFPEHPLFHRALADDLMFGPLMQASRALGYRLR